MTEVVAVGTPSLILERGFESGKDWFLEVLIDEGDVRSFKLVKVKCTWTAVRPPAAAPELQREDWVDVSSGGATVASCAMTSRSPRI